MQEIDFLYSETELALFQEKLSADQTGDVAQGFINDLITSKGALTNTLSAFNSIDKTEIAQVIDDAVKSVSLITLAAWDDLKIN